MTDSDASIIPIKGHLSTGLTKREYFAGMALQGFCAGGWHSNPKIIMECGDKLENVHALIAILSVEIADQIIKQLNEPVTPKRS